jgi:hypothetical protein
MAKPLWQTEQNVDGLIDLFESIPSDQYNGWDGSRCLIGYPTQYGVLREEYDAYWAACCALHQPVMRAWEWLAARYNVDPQNVYRIYGGVANEKLFNDLDLSIEFAKSVLLGVSDADES